VVVAAPDGFTAGVVVTRLMAALWTEDLAGAVRYDPERSTATVTVRDADVGNGLRPSEESAQRGG
jgi:hypothetical protein